MPKGKRRDPEFVRYVGLRIAAARESARIMQKTLAMQVGVDTGTVGGWEVGHSLPSLQDLAVIAEYLGRPLDYFVGKDVPAGLDDYQRDIVALTNIMDDDARRLLLSLAEGLATASRSRGEARTKGR